MVGDIPGDGEEGNELRSGRKPFVPSDDHRARVRELAGEGRTRRVIASVIGVSIPTLRAHFAAELAAPKPPAAQTLFDLSAPPPVTSTRANRRRPPSGGRPVYTPSAHDRERVLTMAAGGATQAAMARILGVSEPTLRLAYAAEISIAAEVRYAEALESLRRQGLKGSTSAMKAYMDEVRKAHLAEMSKAFTAAPATQADTPKPRQIGKKEAQQAAAHRAATESDWASVLGTGGTPIQ